MLVKRVLTQSLREWVGQVVSRVRFGRHYWTIVTIHHCDAGQMRAFLEWAVQNYEIVSLADGRPRLQSAQLTRPLLSITYDDGDLTVFDEAMPVHREMRIPAIVFVCPAWADRGVAMHENERRRLSMTWSHLREWVSHGLEIGGHSINHIPLTQASLGRAQWEILTCADRIEQECGCRVRSFAYPWGLYTRQLADWMQGSGRFDSIVTCDECDVFPSHTGNHFGRRPLELGHRPARYVLRRNSLKDSIRRQLNLGIQAEVSPKPFTLNRFCSESEPKLLAPVGGTATNIICSQTKNESVIEDNGIPSIEPLVN